MFLFLLIFPLILQSSLSAIPAKASADTPPAEGSFWCICSAVLE